VTEAPRSEVVAAVTAAGGRAPADWSRVVGGGYTPAERWVVTYDDGVRAFAKVGTTDLVSGWLRDECRAYSEIRGSFMPRLVGCLGGEVPVLLIEDLSDAIWPPPWRPELVQRTLTTLDEVATTRAPDWASPIDALSEIFSGWSGVAANPGPFLGLGLVSPAWLDSALSQLIAHERPAQLAGSALIHFDVRSDNLCFSGDRTLLIDWNHAARGNPLFDVAAWLPSLAVEGGPLPEEVRPEAGIFAPALAGYFCSRAPMPPIPDAPHVRRVQLEQASTALPWAARWLGLPEPDGPASSRSG
jgi:Phosphotransferase enzyme family